MNSKRIRKITYISLGILAIIVSAIALLRYDSLTGQAIVVRTERRKASVAITFAKRQSHTAWTFAEGTVHAWRREYVQSDAAGIVTELGAVNGQPIREGIRVNGPEGNRPGDLLVRLDCRTLMAEQNALEADLKGVLTDLAQAERNHKRAQTMHNKNLMALADFEQSLTVYQTAKSRANAAAAQLERIKVSIDKAVLRAPFDGIIKRINVRVGDYYEGAAQRRADSEREASALVVIIDTRQLEAVLNIPLWYADQVKVGQRVYLANYSPELSQAARSGFRSGKFAVGKVYSKSPSISLDKRSIEVKVWTKAGTQHLLDGSHIIAWIVIDERENILTIPNEAVIGREAGEFAYVYDTETQTVVERRLTIGKFGLDDVEIIEGINEGEAVVIDGLFNLTHGTPVMVVGSDDENR